MPRVVIPPASWSKRSKKHSHFCPTLAIHSAKSSTAKIFKQYLKFYRRINSIRIRFYREECNQYLMMSENSFLLAFQCLHFINIRPLRSPLPVAARSRRQRAPSFSRRIASFHTISSTSHLAPLPVSVYKRSPGDSGQRCLVGLARRAHQVI